MNELKIKIGIIKRLHGHKGLIESHPCAVDSVFGVAIDPQLERYVSSRDLHSIMRDIVAGIPIAIELDNLQINWD